MTDQNLPESSAGDTGRFRDDKTKHVANDDVVRIGRGRALDRSSIEINGDGQSPNGQRLHGVKGEENRGFAPASAGYRGDYRDYRSADYRGVDYRGLDYRAGELAPEANEAQINWVAALWRYRFALILPTLVGLAAGGAYFTTLPNLYRSTARIVVESEQPWTPGHESLEAVRKIPPAEMLLMQLRSQQVLDHAIEHPLLADAVATMGKDALRGALSRGVGFQNAMASSQNDRVVPFNLNFDDQDPQLTVGAVSALSDALRKYFEQRSESSIAELKKLITTAKDKLLPELNSLEDEYREFRESSELSWDKTGAMINPYREKQLSLESRRLVLEDEQRELLTKVAAIEETMKATKDPIATLEVVQQLLGKEIFAARESLAQPATGADVSWYRDSDLTLARLTIERELLPLELERQQFATQFGAGHPSVRLLDQQIMATREKLNELTTQENDRKAQLRKEGEIPTIEAEKRRKQQAELAVSGFLRSLETRRAVTQSQIDLISAQVKNLSEQASRLTRAESENSMYLRRIERAQLLFDSVEEQMSKITLSDQDASIHVTQLNAPSPPALIAPILSRYLAMGTLWGAMLGMGLVYLLESQAKTYRGSEEISRLLGLRVLSHVPTDTHKLPKLAKGEVYRYKDIDPGLSAVHRPRSITSEAIRRLRTSVFFEAKTTGASVIQVTSPLPEDGKSTLVANLAISIARSGKRVVIVDSDMRRPQMTSSFRMEKLDGLSQLIDGAVEPTQVVHATVIENLWVVPCGPVPANPAEALSMHQYSEFLAWLRDRFDFVIVDTPPLLIVTDPSIVASCVDAVIFTFRLRRGCRPQTKEAVAMLRATGTPILGCVVNRVDSHTLAAGYQGYDGSSRYSKRYNRHTVSGTVEINGVDVSQSAAKDGFESTPSPVDEETDMEASTNRSSKGLT